MLLSINGKPVGSGEDLDKALQSATPGAAPLTLKLLHAGEAVEKQVAPAKADQQALISSFLMPGRTIYRIGVLATVPTTLDPTCRLLQQHAAKAGKEIALTRGLVEGLDDP